MTVEQLLQALTIAAAVVAILGYLDTRRKYTMEKGSQEQKWIQAEADIKSAHDKIRSLECSSQSAQISAAEMKKDIEYIKASVDKVENTLGELRDLFIKNVKNPAAES